jgi:hypothetical protein
MSEQQSTQQRTDSHNGQGWFSSHTAGNLKPVDATTQPANTQSVEQYFDGTMRDILRLLVAAASRDSTTVVDTRGFCANRKEALLDTQKLYAEGMKICSEHPDAAQTQINEFSAVSTTTAPTGSGHIR